MKVIILLLCVGVSLAQNGGDGGNGGHGGTFGSGTSGQNGAHGVNGGAHGAHGCHGDDLSCKQGMGGQSGRPGQNGNAGMNGYDGRPGQNGNAGMGSRPSQNGSPGMNGYDGRPGQNGGTMSPEMFAMLEERMKYLSDALAGTVMLTPPPHERCRPGDDSCGSDNGPVSLVNVAGTDIHVNQEARVTWSEADAWCKSKGLELLSLPNKRKSDDIARYLKDTISYNLHFWTSGKRTGSQFTWTATQTPFSYTRWESRSTNPRHGQDCVSIMEDTGPQLWTWFAEECDRNNQIICEKP